MDLKQIIEQQKDFDRKHFGEIKLTPERLLYLMTCLAGETGELANLVKKYYREKVRNYRLPTDGQEDFLSLMKEELTDVFIYTIILSYMLDVDLEKEFFNKLKKNEERFKNVNLNNL
ncbi:MAG: MazG nucleotide pyrophosphohydrolase domain-containing protein [Patescibacteria group bacterium]